MMMMMMMMMMTTTTMMMMMMMMIIIIIIIIINAQYEMFILGALVRFVIDFLLREGTPLDTCMDRSTTGMCHLKISYC